MSHPLQWKTVTPDPTLLLFSLFLYASSPCTCMPPCEAMHTYPALISRTVFCLFVHFFFLLSDNWAAMTTAFPPNGRGQINLPVLMSVNGTGPLLPPPCSTSLLWVSECLWMSVSDAGRCIRWWVWCRMFDSEMVEHLTDYNHWCPRRDGYLRVVGLV